VADVVFVLIGAGSTVFTPGLLRDLAQSPLADDFDVRLVDLNADAAETMARLGARVAEQADTRMRVSAVTDRRQALQGATFVVTTIAVGSADGWRADLDVPARHGVHQTVGDSVGPGGVLRALRHVPELVAIARDVEELAPQAWLVNYSNPLTVNVRAVRRATGVRAVGLCHGTMHTRSALAAELDVPGDELNAVFAGLNHLCWLLDVRVGTEDLYPRLRELAEQRANDGRHAESDPREGLHQPVSADLLTTFGRYPAPGDRHVSEFFADYLAHECDGTLAWGLQGGQDMTRRYIDEKSSLWDRLRAQASGDAALEIGGNQEAERLVSIAEAFLTGRDLLELAVNVPNRGAIANLPSEAVVEVPALVNGSGVTPLAVGELPAGIAAVLSARIHQQELTVEAALTRDTALAVEALVLDPLVPDSRTARAILRDAALAQPETLRAFG
jgi:alpha-galactosidase/6-phospho-beta-glucosidase family protein